VSGRALALPVKIYAVGVAAGAWCPRFSFAERVRTLSSWLVKLPNGLAQCGESAAWVATNSNAALGICRKISMIMRASGALEVARGVPAWPGQCPPTFASDKG
jgi:hypothetical protein